MQKWVPPCSPPFGWALSFPPKVWICYCSLIYRYHWVSGGHPILSAVKMFLKRVNKFLLNLSHTVNPLKSLSSPFQGKANYYPQFHSLFEIIMVALWTEQSTWIIFGPFIRGKIGRRRDLNKTQTIPYKRHIEMRLRAATMRLIEEQVLGAVLT